MASFIPERAISKAGIGEFYSKLLYTGSECGEINWFDTRCRSAVGFLAPNPDIFLGNSADSWSAVTAMDFDGKTLAVGDDNGVVWCFDPRFMSREQSSLCYDKFTNGQYVSSVKLIPPTSFEENPSKPDANKDDSGFSRIAVGLSDGQLSLYKLQ
ncbi:hypothetical protein AYI68_g170 [Smittium mucronatum]|uniref:Uncharacterized protein n=1 Tax=Smittium mucronatum TaxID=133383 RepID=A0A1R0H8Z7_9FUNG|nr:hypothetical protein AYI68_g170 [Smittium mucronatum]